MLTRTLDRVAREALGSACEAVADAGPDDHVDGVPVGVVARPGSTGEVAEVLRAAAAHGLTVVPRGRGTKLTWGVPPRRADVVVDVSAMDRVLDHAAGDLIVAAQAGTTLSDVQQVTAQGGQRLTLDETVPGGTVGGALATNASGARRTSVGTARDLLIGITMVRADGVVAKAGGRVVKNVAGYDIGKLLIGSYGTLAVVVDATFRLHPVPAAARWVSVPVRTPLEALERTQAAVHSQMVPAAVEVGWDTSGGVVSVLLEGRTDGVAGRVARLRSLLGEGATDDDAAPAGGLTHPWDLAATGDDRATAVKLTLALSGLADVLSEAGSVGASVRGSAGSGVLYAALAPGTPVAEVVTSVERLRAACLRHGGSAVVLDASGEVKQAVDSWGPVPTLGLMRRVKEQFDPDHRLSPGRFVGGI